MFAPFITLPEVVHVVRRNAGSHVVPRLLRFLLATPATWIEVTREDTQRATEIIESYPEARLDLVDAAIAAIAERVGVTRILTLDRRDFSVIRPRHCESFEVLP